MSNNGIFISQLASTIVFIIALFVLYRLLVEKKEATIQFLQAQVAEAKQPMPDALLKAQKDRIDAAYAEVARLSDDRQALAGMNQNAWNYIDSLKGVIAADERLIELQKKVIADERKAHEDYQKWLSDILEKLSEGKEILVEQDKNGVVQNVVITPKEEK